MTGLLKCSCGQYVTENKEQIKVHERRDHSYNHAAYTKVRNDVPLTKEEKDRVALQGATRLGLHHFFGFETVGPVPKPEIGAADIKYYHGPLETVK